MSFAPSSGPIGTVVTVKGNGFTGSNLGWVGLGKNAAVSVLSDTQLQVTVPAGATSGAIGIFNPSFAAFSATAFTVANAAAVVPQPGIQNFAPSSGAAGTVVTLNGNGFTGLTHAWLGNARAIPVRVLNDGQAQLTIPADATTGAIGLFNAAHAAFTASSFSVTSSAAVYRQPGIQNFAPSAGPVGTVVTLNGTGFSGANLAWIGNAKNGTVRVLSDSQVQVTIPAGATTGAIGIFNPSFVAFTATSFSVR